MCKIFKVKLSVDVIDGPEGSQQSNLIGNHTLNERYTECVFHESVDVLFCFLKVWLIFTNKKIYNWKSLDFNWFTTYFDSRNISFILSVHYISQDEQFSNYRFLLIRYNFFLNLHFLVNCLCKNIIFNVLPVVSNRQKYWSRCIIACYYLAWSSLMVITCRWFIVFFYI